MFRFIIPALLLIVWILTPGTALAQTRFFERGDSGFIPTFEIIGKNADQLDDLTTGLRVTYTYKGMFDVGIGVIEEYGDQSFGEMPHYVLGNFVVLGPKSTAGIGLEIKGRYTSQSTLTDFRFPFYESRLQTFESGFRAFHRNSKANLIFGLGLNYRFKKDQSLNSDGDVLWGHDCGEVGFNLDIQFQTGRIVHFSLQGEYAQNKQIFWADDWLLTVILSAGFMIDLNSETGGSQHE